MVAPSPARWAVKKLLGQSYISTGRIAIDRPLKAVRNAPVANGVVKKAMKVTVAGRQYPATAVAWTNTRRSSVVFKKADLEALMAENNFSVDSGMLIEEQSTGDIEISLVPATQAPGELFLAAPAAPVVAPTAAAGPTPAAAGGAAVPARRRPSKRITEVMRNDSMDSGASEGTAINNQADDEGPVPRRRKRSAAAFDDEEPAALSAGKVSFETATTERPKRRRFTSTRFNAEYLLGDQEMAASEEEEEVVSPPAARRSRPRSRFSRSAPPAYLLAGDKKARWESLTEVAQWVIEDDLDIFMN